MPLLTQEQIKETMEAKKLSDWKLSGKEITRQFVLKDFVQAIAFVNKVAEAAEAANHHPDILIQWNKVTFTLSTHDSGGLTKNDFNLAEKINSLSSV